MSLQGLAFRGNTPSRKILQKPARPLENNSLRFCAVQVTTIRRAGNPKRVIETPPVGRITTIVDPSRQSWSGNKDKTALPPTDMCHPPNLPFETHLPWKKGATVCGPAVYG